MGENSLRLKAQEAIRAGRLPSHAASRMVAGSGLGATCPVCSDRVTHEEPGWDLEFAPRNGETGPLQRVDVHVSCFVAWELERHKFAPPRHAAARRHNLSVAGGDGRIFGRVDPDANGHGSQ